MKMETIAMTTPVTAMTITASIRVKPRSVGGGRRIAGSPALQADGIVRPVAGRRDGDGDLQRLAAGHAVQGRGGDADAGRVARETRDGRTGHVADARHREAAVVVDVVEEVDRAVAALAGFRPHGLLHGAGGGAGGGVGAGGGGL